VRTSLPRAVPDFGEESAVRGSSAPSANVVESKIIESSTGVRPMETEKILTLAAMIIAGLLTLLFVLDLALGIPFGRQSIVLDVLFLLGGGFILWQGLETYREFT
jgi:hypothetical protein